jgi:hypothetical protein
MADIGAIAAGLSSIKIALDITKEFRNIDTSFKDAEMKLKLAELIEALSDTKFALSDVRDENLELKEKVRLLEAKLNQKDEVLFRDGHYYLASPTSGKPEGPFCSKCYSDEDKLILLDEFTPEFRVFGKYNCPKCNAASS